LAGGSVGNRRNLAGEFGNAALSLIICWSSFLQSRDVAWEHVLSMLKHFPFDWEAWPSRCSMLQALVSAYKDKMILRNVESSPLKYTPKLLNVSSMPTFIVLSEIAPFCSSFARADSAKAAIEHVIPRLMPHIIPVTDGNHAADPQSPQVVEHVVRHVTR
jgi:hypothetical protein